MYKPKATKRRSAATAKDKRTKKTSPIDNIIDESLLRQAIGVEYEIKLLQEKREKVRSLIMEQMDSNGVAFSNNDLATVSMMQREMPYISAVNVKKNAPELFRELDKGGYVTRAKQRYCMIYPKI